MPTHRRTFLLSLVATGGLLSVREAFSQTALDEKDPQAVALGYVADTARADAKKYPKHDKSQVCSGCALWQSKPTDAAGNCALFAGKPVSAKGWCSAWSRKA